MTVTVSLGKIRARVDFDADEFDKTVFQLGARCLWSRALECPCRLNEQTRRPDPTCDVCYGDGYFYVKPGDGGRLAEYDHKPKHEDTATGLATQVLVQSVTKDPQVYEKFGEWLFGTVRLTPFSFNKLDYRDRITLTDTTTSYRQVMAVPESLTWPAPNGRHNPDEVLRYPAKAVRAAYTVESGVAADVSDHLTVNDDGSITVAAHAAVPVGRRITLSYSYNPVLIALDHAYAWRDTMQISKTTHPVGVNVPLPNHSMAKLDYLVQPA